MRTLVLVCAGLIGVGGGAAIAALHGAHRSRISLPALHGQAVWAAGTRAAPTAGMPPLRGRTSVVTFMDPRCTSVCPVEGRQLASVLRRLPAAERPAVVLVSVDPTATAADAARATRKWQLAPFSTRWVLGTHAELRRIWAAYGVAVRATRGDVVHTLVLYLVDRRGDERTAYLFPFVPAFVQGDLARLARERT
jgi:cytochrome oxidase Cu insertion factor (SCO1/SenC/PrrC family)